MHNGWYTDQPFHWYIYIFIVTFEREFVLWIQLQKVKLQLSIRNGRQNGKFYISIYLSTIPQNWVGESQLLVRIYETVICQRLLKTANLIYFNSCVNPTRWLQLPSPLLNRGKRGRGVSAPWSRSHTF